MEKKELKKSLRPIHLWAIAVGLVISGDYFGWNYGYKSGLSGFFFAVLFVTIFYISFAFSFTELSTSLPNAGGPFTYANRALGNIGGFIAAFSTLIEFLLASPAIAFALGSYFHFIFPSANPTYASLAFLAFFTWINLIGIKQTANFELVITIIASLGILLYLACILPFSKPMILFTRLNEFNFTSLFSAIPFAIWFYLAVEGVAMAAEETENPSRDIPIGYSFGIGTLVFFALSVMIFTTGLEIETKLLETDHPLAQALEIIYGKDSLLVKIFGLIGLIGIMASLLGIILGYTRQIYAVARENFLPHFLSKVNEKTGVPSIACIMGSLFGAICILTGKTDVMITLSVLGAICMYIISMISLFVLRKKEPHLIRPYKAPFYPYLPLIALVFAIICLGSVVYTNPYPSLLFLIAFILNLFLFIYTKNKSKKHHHV
jgi:ethanolamine permease